MKTKNLTESGTVSTIIRIHDENEFWQLKNAITSLFKQDYKSIQVIVCAQNASKVFLVDIAEFIQSVSNCPPPLNFDSGTITLGNHTVCSVPIENNKDGRCLLLRKGLDLASGKYLGFLDYDDVLYPKAYSSLISQIRTSNSALAAGGCTKAIYKIVSANHIKELICEHKEPFLDKPSEKKQWDIFYGNFLPIHSFIIDLDIAPKESIQFTDNITLFEDYQILLHLARNFKFDLSLLSTPLCEYRMRLDGSNSIQSGRHNPEKELKWIEARSYIENLKNNLTITVSLKEISDLIHEREALKNQLSIFNRIAYSLVRKLRTFFRINR